MFEGLEEVDEHRLLSPTRDPTAQEKANIRQWQGFFLMQGSDGDHVGVSVVTGHRGVEETEDVVLKGRIGLEELLAGVTEAVAVEAGLGAEEDGVVCHGDGLDDVVDLVDVAEAGVAEEELVGSGGAVAEVAEFRAADGVAAAVQGLLARRDLELLHLLDVVARCRR